MKSFYLTFLSFIFVLFYSPNSHSQIFESLFVKKNNIKSWQIYEHNETDSFDDSVLVATAQFDTSGNIISYTTHQGMNWEGGNKMAKFIYKNEKLLKIDYTSNNEWYCAYTQIFYIDSLHSDSLYDCSNKSMPPSVYRFHEPNNTDPVYSMEGIPRLHANGLFKDWQVLFKKQGEQLAHGGYFFQWYNYNFEMERIGVSQSYEFSIHGGLLEHKILNRENGVDVVSEKTEVIYDDLNCPVDVKYIYDGVLSNHHTYVYEQY